MPDPTEPASTAVDALPPVNPMGDAIELAVQIWWFENIHDSPVSRVADAYNYILSRLPALTAAIVAVTDKEFVK